MNYLLTGPEEYLKHEFVERLKKSILKNDKNSALDSEVFYAGYAEISRILGSLDTLPFISRRRLIIIKDIDEFSAKEKNSFLRYLKKPQDTAVVVLESSLNESGDKFIKEAARFTKSVRCNKLKERELEAWIRKQFASDNKKISPDVARLFIELAGNNMFSLKNEIDKIISFTGKRREISRADIEGVLGRSVSKTVFELVDLILNKRVEKIPAITNVLPIKEKPHQILNLLAWQFRNFLKVKKLKENISAEAAAGKLNTTVWQGRKALRFSKYFTRRHLERNLEIILEADFFIKRGKMDATHALERALAGLCR